MTFAALLLLAAPAAPVPPPPRDLTPEMMAGTWRYEYGVMRDGSITLNADGTYRSDHGNGTTYRGTWTVRGNALTLEEWVACPDGDRFGGVYRFEFDPRAFPALRGACNGWGVPVCLSSRAR